MVDLEEEIWNQIIVPEVSQKFGCATSTISRKQTLGKDYRADSLDLLQLTINVSDRIETKYGIENFVIPSNIDPEPKTLGDLSAYLAKRIDKERTI